MSSSANKKNLHKAVVVVVGLLIISLHVGMGLIINFSSSGLFSLEHQYLRALLLIKAQIVTYLFIQVSLLVWSALLKSGNEDLIILKKINFIIFLLLLISKIIISI